MKTRILNLREERHILQAALAAAIGTTQSTISKIETGHITPDAGMIIQLSKYFNVSSDYILCLSEERMGFEYYLNNNFQFSEFIADFNKLTIKQKEYAHIFVLLMQGKNTDFVP